MRSNGSNYEDSHPTEARLLLALDDELERHETVAIARHVERCAACQGQWEQLRRISGEIVLYHDHLAEALMPVLPRTKVSIWARVRSLSYVAAAAVAMTCAAWFYVKTGRPNLPSRHVAMLPPGDTRPAPSANVVPAVRHRYPARRHDRVDAEVATFMALPFSDNTLPLGDATVVRVELPIEELRLTGLTVDGGLAGALLQADVLMGMDGLPRGIRFVQ